MSQSKHTPGPWHIQNKGNLYGPSGRVEIVAGEQDGEGICVVRGLSKTAYANARVMAAAPDLKESLEMLLDRLAFFGSIDPIREEGPIEDAYAALAKATDTE